MATVAERVSVVEVQVANLDEKIDDLKVDVKEMHDCLDQTRDGVMAELQKMAKASNSQHSDLYTKISELEKSKQKMMMYGMIGMAFIAGLGWTGQLNIHTITKFFGV